MSKLVPPHGGGTLRPLLLEGAAVQAETERASALPGIVTSSRETGDVLMLGIGGYTPLDGFMTHDDWKSVCDDMQLASGLFWPIPITLSTTTEIAARIKPGSEGALMDAAGSELLASMQV